MPGNRVTQPVKGPRGEQGYSIKSASLVGDNLVLQSTSGSTFDVGNVKGAAGPAGASGSDLSNPSEPTIIVENFLAQGEGQYATGVAPLLFDGDGNYTVTHQLNVGGTNPIGGDPSVVLYEADSETGHPGVIKIKVKAASAGEYGSLTLGRGGTSNLIKWDDFHTLYYVIKTPANTGSVDTESTNYDMYFGLFSDASDTTVNGIYFRRLNGASWTPVCVNSSTASTGTTTAYATNTWYTLRIRKINATTVGFTVNNGTEYTISTNIPTGVLLDCGLVIKNNTANTSVCFLGLDFFSLKTGIEGASTTNTIVGTANEVEVTGPLDNIITVGLPNEVTIENLNIDSIDFDTTIAAPVLAEGQLSWDNDYETLALGMVNGVTAQLGQSIYKRVRNGTATQIDKGNVVYVKGAHGQSIITVEEANASLEATAAGTLGVAAMDIAGNGEGWVITQGYLRGITTGSFSAPADEGKIVWLSTTTGEMTLTRPTAPNHGVVVGYLVKSAGSGAGSIFVKVTNGQELDELHDVYIDKQTIANFDILRWNSSTSRFEVANAQKIFNLPAARLVGRWFGAGTGSLQEVTIGTGLDLSNAGVLSSKNLVSDSLTLTASTGLTGGGDLTTNRSFAVDFAASGTSSATKAVRADDVRLADPTDPLSPVLYVEDFLNQNNEAGEIGVQGWNFVNVSLPQMAGELNHPGIVRIRCSATANQVGYMTTALTSAGGTNQFSIDNLKEFTIIFRDVQTDMDTYRVYGMCGVATSTTALFSGVYIRKILTGLTSGTWQFVTRTAAGAETATTFQAQDTNWHKMKVTYSAGSVSFYMDGATSPTATHTTNIPTNLIVSPYLVLIPTTANLVRTSDWDFCSYTLNSITR